MELQLDLERTADHSEAAVGEAIAGFKEMCDILLVLGASAIADRRDVPVAIESTGGKVLQFGMPVDPGNLTLLARLDDMWIVGLPGSARSPRTHGSDWIVQRLVAGLEVAASDIRSMGVGGLLKEIPSRPMPRAEASPPSTNDHQNKAAATSFRPVNLAEWGHKTNYWPILTATDDCRTVDALSASKVASITASRHEAEQVRAVRQEKE